MSVDREKADLRFILYSSLFLAIGVLSRQYMTSVNVMLPSHVMSWMCGFLLGFLVDYVPDLSDPMYMDKIGPATLLNLYAVLLMFDCGFNTEIHYLKVMVYHVVVVILPTLVCTFALMPVIGTQFFNYNFTTEDYVILMCITILPGPHITKAFLFNRSIAQDLKMMIYAESVFGQCITFTILELAFKGDLMRVVPVCLRIGLDLFCGPIIGIVVGKIIVYCLKKTFKDHVNQTTILVALIYVAFAVCHLLHIAGLTCLVTVGLVVSDKKACFSTQTIRIVNK